MKRFSPAYTFVLIKLCAHVIGRHEHVKPHIISICRQTLSQCFNITVFCKWFLFDFGYPCVVRRINMHLSYWCIFVLLHDGCMVKNQEAHRRFIQLAVKGQYVYQCYTLNTLKNQEIFSWKARVSHPVSLDLYLPHTRLHMNEILFRGQ